MNSLRAAVYVRVSTTGQSTELQLKEVKKYIISRGWDLCAVFEDSSTGTSTQRAGFVNLFGAARNRQFDVIVVWKLDRFCRSLSHLVRALEDLQALGVMFVSLRDQIDLTTPSGRLMTHIIAAFAEFEASLIKERVLAGLDNARRKGTRLGRPPKISKATILEFRASGMSMSEIASQLGVSKSSVSKTLKQIRLRKELNNRDST